MALFKKLRTTMYADDLTQKDIARIIKKSESYVALRMSGKYPFSMDDVYTICKYFDLSLDLIAEYFPPGGKPAKQKGDTYEHSRTQ